MVLKEQEAVAVAVTKTVGVLLCFLLLSLTCSSAILENDKAEILYHSYDGGGMKINGPALLIRKKANESVALSAFYYVDTISSASVDVMSTASPYSEKRTEGQLGIEFLYDKTVLAVTIGQSDESDYLAKTINFNVSHDTFGDLTNVSLGVSYGDDDVKRNGDDTFLEQSRHYRIRAGMSQIITRNFTLNLNVEAVSDEGFLNNPYRTVRYVNELLPSGVGHQAENYPRTRNSLAGKISASYYLPYRAALFVHYRYFSDSWNIDSQDFEIGYRHPFGEQFELELKARFYQQSQASFYNDLFPHINAQNYLARDKELSDFDDNTIGLGVTYKLPSHFFPSDWQSEATIQWDHLNFNYNNFRDPTAGEEIGAEPLYKFSADVIRAFISVYF